MKTIKFYRKTQYGLDREFVSADCQADAASIAGLTGLKTITPRIRALIEELTDGAVKFEEVLAPKN
jgi:hypothetical protein